MRRAALVALVALLAILGAGIWSAARVAQISTQPWSLAGSSGDTRILILGYGGGQHPGAYLSDSMLLLSESGGRQAEISIPRDLWVQLPPNSGHYAKINAALAEGVAQGGLDAGGNLALEKAQQVTGLRIDGWVLANFQGFRRMVDALGGVNVNVQRAFSSEYPVNDNPNIDARWKVIHFAAGPQHMNGEQALEYARARYADTPLEASDFARSARQQRLIAAIKDKLLSPAGVVRFVPLANAVAGTFHMNLPPLRLGEFLAGFHPSTAKHVLLDTSNVLANGRSAGGQDILLPRNDNYSLIVQYIKSQIA